MTPKKNTDPVLRRFRRQFIVVIMGFVAVLLIAVFAVASYMTFTQREADVRNALDARSDSMHRMPVEMLLGDEGGFRNYPLDADAEFFLNEGPGSERGRGEPRNAGDDPLVATSAFLLNQDGDIQLTVSNVLNLDTTTVEEALDDIRGHLELNDENIEFGQIKSLNLYYQLRDYSNGYSVALASGNYVDRALFSLMRTLATVETAAFLLLLGISILLSRWVVGPVERAWEQQRQFIADASHELKTPLSVIRANDSLLMADPSASVASQMQWIESTETEAMLMQDLVNDMLYLAQSENTQHEIVQTPVDFSNVVQSVELQFESVAFERGVILDSQIAQGIKVMGEEKSLGRLTGTLIDNACKYAQDGGVASIKLQRTGSHCTLSVTNSGEIIPEEDIPHLFDRFYRSDKARTREQGGFGLGLAIAKSIVDEHKGTISVTSIPKEGTTFSVTLPVV